MNKLYREVVVMNDKEHRILVKLARESKQPKSRILREAFMALHHVIDKVVI